VGDGDEDDVGDAVLLVDAALDDMVGEVVTNDWLDFVLVLVVGDLLDVLLDDLFGIGDGLLDVLLSEGWPSH
jgi:hypothetical protein